MPQCEDWGTIGLRLVGLHPPSPPHPALPSPQKEKEEEDDFLMAWLLHHRWLRRLFRYSWSWQRSHYVTQGREGRCLICAAITPKWLVSPWLNVAATVVSRHQLCQGKKKKKQKKNQALCTSRRPHQSISWMNREAEKRGGQNSNSDNKKGGTQSHSQAPGRAGTLVATLQTKLFIKQFPSFRPGDLQAEICDEKQEAHACLSDHHAIQGPPPITKQPFLPDLKAIKASGQNWLYSVVFFLTPFPPLHPSLSCRYLSSWCQKNERWE